MALQIRGNKWTIKIIRCEGKWWSIYIENVKCDPYLTPYTNKFPVDYRIKYGNQNFKSFIRKHRIVSWWLVVRNDYIMQTQNWLQQILKILLNNRHNMKNEGVKSQGGKQCLQCT